MTQQLDQQILVDYTYQNLHPDSRTRSESMTESLTATEITDLNRRYGQFSAYVVELLVAIKDLV